MTEKVTYHKTKNAKRGIITGVFNKLVTLLLPFIARTLLIKYIGIDYAGLNVLFASLLQMLNLAELGFSGAVVYSMYKPIAENDTDTICALLNFYKKIYFNVGLVILAGGLAALPFLSHFINGTPPANVNIYIIFLIYLTSTCMSYMLYAYKISILNAYQRVDIINNIGSFITILSSGLQIAVILVFDNFYAYVIVIPVTTLIRNILTTVVVNKKFPDFKCKGEITPTLKRDIYKKTSGLVIMKVCFLSRDSIMNIFITSFIGLTIAGIYSNYYLIFTSVVGILSIVPTVMTAGIGNDVQVSSVEHNYMNLRKFNFMYMCISAIATCCLFSLYQPFMYLWLGEKFMLSPTTVSLLVLYFYLCRMGDIRSIWVDAAGLFWEIRWRAIIEAVLNIAMSYIFIRLWGINGMLIATIIVHFLINFIYSSIITFKYYFGISRLYAYYKIQMILFATTVIFCITSYFCFTGIEQLLPTSNIWCILMMRFIIASTLSILLFVLCFHRTQEFKMSVTWAKSKIKHSKNTI